MPYVSDRRCKVQASSATYTPVIPDSAVQRMSSIRNLVERNLRGRLCVVDILGKCTVCAVLLLLNRGAELHEIFGHFLVRCFEHVDESVEMC